MKLSEELSKLNDASIWYNLCCETQTLERLAQSGVRDLQAAYQIANRERWCIIQALLFFLEWVNRKTSDDTTPPLQNGAKS